MDVEDIWRRRLTEQYDRLILRTLERYGYDLKTTLYLLSIGEMKIEKDGFGATIFYAHGNPLFSITEKTYQDFYLGKYITRLRAKDLTNNNYDLRVER